MFKRITILLAIAPILAAASIMFWPQSADALSGSQFRAGRIIDDEVFFNGNGMTSTQIQSFLNAKVPVCDTNGTQPYGGTTRKAYAASRGVSTPFICLKSFKQNTPSKAGESGLCSALSAKINRTAAQIIDDVARACGINQKSLIVLLQKEQSLITDDWPWPIQYRSATGYGCPDTAPCDSEYYGFFNQVYNAARQFKRYAADPTYFNHRPYANNFVRYNPNSACGGSTVFITNQATAGLYNYTPYQPNAAALNNLYGSGNSCSAYGNRNFWRMYNDWFGSTYSSEKLRFIKCDAEYYSVETGVYQKRLMTAAARQAWGLSASDFSETGFGCELPTFSVPAERLVRSRNTGDVYLVDKARAYKISNQSIANSWGLGNLDQTLPQFYGSSLYEELSVKKSIARFVKSDNDAVTKQYILDSGKRYLISGTDEVSITESLRLVKGYDQIPLGVFSVELLASLPQDVEVIDYNFKVGTDLYLLDHGKIKKATSASKIHWDNIVTGPTLSSSVLSIFPQEPISRFFQRDGSYYQFIGDGDLQRTAYRYISADWGSSNPPLITRLLTNKILGDATPSQILGVTGNVRLVSCNSSRFLVERGIRKKRPITSEGLTDWGLNDKYFLQNDTKACSYPSYSLAVTDLVRSRTTAKVYHIDESNAYFVHSLVAAQQWQLGDVNSQTHPQFDGKSINDLLDVFPQLPPL